MSKFDLILKNGRVLTGGSSTEAEFKNVDIGIKDEVIVEISDDLSNETASETRDCSGLTVLPGLIDTQVHFREPGLVHKEDIESGSKGAVLGGLVAYFEMPNTTPPTTNVQQLQAKFDIASETSWCDYSFYAGATLENLEDLKEMVKLPGCCGVKIFMGSSTGSLLVDEIEGLEQIFQNVNSPIAIHSEDETRLKQRLKEIPEGATASYHPIWRDEETALISTKNLLSAARKVRQPGQKVHVLHISTAEEMKLLKDNKDVVTVECTPQHLTLKAPDSYEQLGSLSQMNPPIRDEKNRKGLWEGIENGTVDIIGSDHAPHTLEEKQRPYPQSPSGMTGVQTTVPVMLNHVNEGRLSLERLVELMHFNPVRIFSIKDKGGIVVGKEASFTIVDLNKTHTITDDWIASKSQWTPYNNKKVTGWPEGTVVRGQTVMWESAIVQKPQSKFMQFEKPYL